MNTPAEHPVDETAIIQGHEVREANVRLLIKFGVGLFVLSAVSMLLMWGLFVTLEQYNASLLPEPSPLTETDQIPPAPRLQVIPEEDLIALRAAEKEKLETYGWVIRTANIVRIPIERAMEITAERGLPVRPQSSETP